MKALAPGSWLNDEIINFYMEMLNERDAALVQAGLRTKRNHFFNSFFFSKLVDEGGYNYANVRRWTIRAKVNIFERDLVIIPVNVNNNHWTLLVIDMEAKEIRYYDSMVSKAAAAKYTKAAMDYLVDEAKDKNKPIPDPDEWRLLISSAPQQKDFFNCGVYTIVNADLLASGLQLNYTPDDVRDMRVAIAGRILRGYVRYDGDPDKY